MPERPQPFSLQTVCAGAAMHAQVRTGGRCFSSLELQMLKHSLQKIAPPVPLLRVFVVLGIVTGTLMWLTSQRQDQRADIRQGEFSSQSKGRVFYPTAEQWATLTVEPVQQRVFQSEHVTEGKIAVDEDRSTPIFSP